MTINERKPKEFGKRFQRKAIIFELVRRYQSSFFRTGTTKKIPGSGHQVERKFFLKIGGEFTPLVSLGAKNPSASLPAYYEVSCRPPRARNYENVLPNVYLNVTPPARRVLPS